MVPGSVRFGGFPVRCVVAQGKQRRVRTSQGRVRHWAGSVAVLEAERKAEMTPEQEALYALQWNVPRSELSMAAQIEYDRLRPAWERGEDRPTAEEAERDECFATTPSDSA